MDWNVMQAYVTGSIDKGRNQHLVAKNRIL